MLVEVRPTRKLRGEQAVNLTACLSPIVAALCEDSLDLSRVRLVCDWVQYKYNFRNVVDVRPILAPPNHNGGGDQSDEDKLEIAVDLRRCADADLVDIVRDVLANRGDPDALGRVYLEDWAQGTTSKIWEFNALYWRFLGVWEKATGRLYEQALPGGASDARNIAGVHELIQEMFMVWDDLAAQNSLPDELYVIELGVGNGNQAKTWLDEFARLDAEHGTEYYRRLHYMMCDYSEHVLELARKNVADHASHVSSFPLDATTPMTALGFLRYKVFLVYISNVYDNLPTEDVAQIGGHTYNAEIRAYLPKEAAYRIAADFGIELGSLVSAIHKLLSLGPELLVDALSAQFPEVARASAFWMAVWDAVKLEERYVPMTGLDLYQIAPGVNGEMLRPMLERHGDVRMQVSNGAIASFVDTLPLLHPYGRLQCHDIFVTDPHQYRTGFLGPGKYDGSIVNWVNGPLLQHIGRRKGFDVGYAPFAHRTGTNIVTLTAQVRD
ncbi:MAG: hypothetical protein M3313_14305 [Actinomycetota bacterium]|nr:hypothetical protein [Actinomycetota bacterium]